MPRARPRTNIIPAQTAPKARPDDAKLVVFKSRTAADWGLGPGLGTQRKSNVPWRRGHCPKPLARHLRPQQRTAVSVTKRRPFRTRARAHPQKYDSGAWCHARARTQCGHRWQTRNARRQLLPFLASARAASCCRNSRPQYFYYHNRKI